MKIIRWWLALVALLLPPLVTPLGSPAAAISRHDAATTGVWHRTGAMTTTRAYFTATLLPSGAVLAPGGALDGSYLGLTSAELYNPHTHRWTPTGSLNFSRESQTATLLRGGQVLVAGGATNDGALSNAELYNPATGTFTYTVGLMTVQRVFHTATLLRSGRVLLTGGCDGELFGCVYTWNNADLYNPATRTFTATGAMSQARMFHTATLLPSGKVLVAGGTGCGGCVSTNEADLYDPTTGTFTPIPGLMSAPRALHTATLLTNGKVLLVGGCTAVNGPTCPTTTTLLGSADLYDPVTGTFAPTGALNTPRFAHTATLLPSGQVLVAGGQGCGNCRQGLSSAELYDPTTGTWTVTPPMSATRAEAAAVLLAQGGVLVAGGCPYQTYGGDCWADRTSAEIYK